MTHLTTDASSTLLAARARYFEENHFGPDGGYGAAWVDFKLGPIPMPFPNTRARVRAVRFHDLHHVLTEYRTDTLGEFEISAWELGGGCADFVAAWQLSLGGMVAGLVSIPRRTFRAFVRGRHSRNLYRSTYDDALLARTVGEVRRELGLDIPPPHATGSDVAAFLGHVVVGLGVGLMSAALALPMALAVTLLALVRRRLLTAE
ncbi:MAG: hypothetical protein L0Y66_08890 [Myxococcaceae bacterium]|nr:hypothetical protein [Myxococcaceae bacterium]MCI0673686.1 hypothetical protein [Myxococcaceae bacterium]